MTRIVIADDHPFLRAGVEAALAGSGIEVAASVENGEAAMDAVRKEDPDVLVLDVRMPPAGGIAVLQALRDAGDNRPVVLLTAELEDAALLAAVKANVNGIVFKHGAEARLQDAVNTVARGEKFIDPQVMDRALALAIEKPRANPLSDLSARERQIAEAVSEGRRNRDIAAATGLTEGSIKVYLHRIYEKLGIDNRTELAVMVLEQARQ